jgi:prepilin-type N-terminal cleavage/methylation domain-containing protein
VQRTRGFTLIELVLVVVIIGILAAIVIPKFGTTRERANMASMKADLRNLVTAEEGYLAEYATYTSSITSLNYQASSGTTVTLGTASGSGWSATASSTGSTHTCGIYYGTGTPPISGANEGEARCM